MGLLTGEALATSLNGWDLLALRVYLPAAGHGTFVWYTSGRKVSGAPHEKKGNPRKCVWPESEWRTAGQSSGALLTRKSVVHRMWSGTGLTGSSSRNLARFLIVLLLQVVK